MEFDCVLAIGIVWLALIVLVTVWWIMR